MVHSTQRLYFMGSTAVSAAALHQYGSKIMHKMTIKKS